MFNIRNRLLVAIGTVVTLGVIGVETVGFFGFPALRIEGAQARFRADALRRIDMLADEKRNRLQFWMSERQGDLNAIGESPAIANLVGDLAKVVAEGRRHGEPSAAFWARYKTLPAYRALMAELQAIRGSRPETYTVVGIRDAEGGYILASSRGDAPIGAPTLRGNRQFEVARTPGQFKYVDLFVSPVDKIRYLRMTQQIFARDADGTPAALVGVAQFLLPLGSLPIAPGSEAYATEDVYLVGPEGTLMTPPRFPLPAGAAAGAEPVRLRDKAALLAAEGGGGLMTDVDYRGKDVLAAFRHIMVSPDLGWGLVVKQDEDEALLPLYRDVINRVRLAVVWLMALLFVVLVSARRLAAPIARLAAAASAIEGGNLAARSGLVQSDEIGLLARTFDKMAAQTEQWHRSLSAEVEVRTHQLLRLNRLYRTLGETNQAIQRESDSAHLFNRVCAITVEHGGFAAAWISLAPRPDEADRIYRACRAGPPGEPAPDIDALELDCQGCGLLPTSPTALVIPDIEADARAAACRPRMRAAGWHAFVSVPIRCTGDLLGAFRVVTADRQGFDDEAVALLEELAADVGNAVRMIRGEAARHAAEARIKVQEARLQAILASAVDAVVSMDAAGRVEYWNPAAEAMFGYRHDEAIGQPMHALVVPPERLADADGGLGQFAGTGRGAIIGRTVEVLARHRDGHQFPIELAVAAFAKGDAWHAVGIARDIRERKRVEVELAQHRQHLERLVAERTRQADERNRSLEAALERLHEAHRQLVQAEKLSGLGALVAGVAHELNTPIGNARVVASTMADTTREFDARLNTTGGVRRSELRAFIERAGEGHHLIETNLVRAVEIIQSFKQVAVDQASSNRRVFDLKTVVEEILITVRPAFKHTPFEIDCALPVGLSVDGFPGPLGQVIVNLLENARIHGFRGREHGRVRLAAARLDEDRFSLDIADDGHGIAGADLPRIFDPFFTTRFGHGGSGLGLSVVYSIVTGLLGGSIAARSTPGLGTTFSLILPTTAPAGMEQEDGRIAPEAV